MEPFRSEVASGCPLNGLAASLANSCELDQVLHIKRLIMLLELAHVELEIKRINEISNIAGKVDYIPACIGPCRHSSQVPRAVRLALSSPLWR